MSRLARSDLTDAVNRLTDLVQGELSRRERRRARKEREVRPMRKADLAFYLERVVVDGRPLGAHFDKQVAADRLEIGEQSVTVACPCGARHELGPEKLETAECGRAFIWAAGRVYVASAVTADS